MSMVKSYSLDVITDVFSSALRNPTSKVESFEFGTIELNKIILDLKKVINKQKNGMAIAANQVGINKSIIVYQKHKKKFLTFINPTIIKCSNEIIDNFEEGCLSVRDWWCIVKRNKHITVKYQDLSGKVKQKSFDNIESIMMQHEIDHLLGILMTDKAIKKIKREY